VQSLNTFLGALTELTITTCSLSELFKNREREQVVGTIFGGGAVKKPDIFIWHYYN